MNQLYNKTKPLPKSLMNTNKYSFLVYNKIVEAGYLEVSDIFKSDSKLNNYIVDKEKVLIFPNRLDGKITNMFIRGLIDKQYPLKIGANNIPYGLDHFNKDFKYGDPIILVEGLADYGGLKLLDPNLNIIVMFSNALGKDMYEIISKLTNNFIIISDNDEGGRIGFNTLKKRFRQVGITNVNKIEQYGNLKDTGDIVDMLLEATNTNNQYLKDELKIIKNYYLNQIDVYK